MGTPSERVTAKVMGGPMVRITGKDIGIHGQLSLATLGGGQQIQQLWRLRTWLLSSELMVCKQLVAVNGWLMSSSLTGWWFDRHIFPIVGIAGCLTCACFSIGLVQPPTSSWFNGAPIGATRSDQRNFLDFAAPHWIPPAMLCGFVHGGTYMAPALAIQVQLAIINREATRNLGVHHFWTDPLLTVFFFLCVLHHLGWNNHSKCECHHRRFSGQSHKNLEHEMAWNILQLNMEHTCGRIPGGIDPYPPFKVPNHPHSRLWNHTVPDTILYMQEGTHTNNCYIPTQVSTSLASLGDQTYLVQINHGEPQMFINSNDQPLATMNNYDQGSLSRWLLSILFGDRLWKRRC